ncbi:hypothetical protein MNBD_GAMMA09-214 [hydrothermal vent metagenome]|uniref:Uncharacterized protein n=1 Tax=hydrothermal vent metagenome TaxID=652676 RepID=A0A3B0YB65_9ZZZZ
MKKILGLLIVILCVYPLSVFLQLLINWLYSDYHLFWTASELSKKKLMMMFISDWKQALFFILPTAVIIYTLNQLLNTINSYLLPLLIALIAAIFCYLELPSAFIYVMVVSFLLIKIQSVSVIGEKK